MDPSVTCAVHFEPVKGLYFFVLFVLFGMLAMLRCENCNLSIHLYCLMATASPFIGAACLKGAAAGGGC